MLIPFKNNLCSKYAEKMLSIKLLSACNAHCSFCVDDRGRVEESINIDTIALNANNLHEYQTVIITGGEPFLVFDKVIDLIKKLRNNKERIVLNTNGSLITKDKVKKLNGLIDELQISIHHYDEKRNSYVFGRNISFESIKESVLNKHFVLSINSTFNQGYTQEEKPNAVNEMIDLVKFIGGDRLRLTELKKVEESEFLQADEFYNDKSEVLKYSSNELIEKGCTYYYNKNGIDVSVKRLCEYAKGKNAEAFSCCFINLEGQNKIEVDTKETFKVIYGDGLTTNDWIFNQGEAGGRA